MKRFEYKISNKPFHEDYETKAEDIVGPIETWMNELGNEGWEIIRVQEVWIIPRIYINLILKREII